MKYFQFLNKVTSFKIVNISYSMFLKICRYIGYIIEKIDGDYALPPIYAIDTIHIVSIQFKNDNISIKYLFPYIFGRTEKNIDNVKCLYHAQTSSNVVNIVNRCCITIVQYNIYNKLELTQTFYIVYDISYKLSVQTIKILNNSILIVTKSNAILKELNKPITNINNVCYNCGGGIMLNHCTGCKLEGFPNFDKMSYIVPPKSINLLPAINIKFENFQVAYSKYKFLFITHASV